MLQRQQSHPEQYSESWSEEYPQLRTHDIPSGRYWTIRSTNLSYLVHNIRAWVIVTNKLVLKFKKQIWEQWWSNTCTRWLFPAETKHSIYWQNLGTILEKLWLVFNIVKMVNNIPTIGQAGQMVVLSKSGDMNLSDSILNLWYLHQSNVVDIQFYITIIVTEILQRLQLSLDTPFATAFNWDS